MHMQYEHWVVSSMSCKYALCGGGITASHWSQYLASGALPLPHFEQINVSVASLWYGFGLYAPSVPSPPPGVPTVLPAPGAPTPCSPERSAGYDSSARG